MSNSHQKPLWDAETALRQGVCRWRPVPVQELYEEYDVSEYGHVRWVRYLGDDPRRQSIFQSLDERGRLLKGGSTQDGYLNVKIKRKGRFYISACRHVWVALAFLGAPPESGWQIDHIDGNKQNNHYSNLEWVSIETNIRRAHRLGLSLAKLTEEQVSYILYEAQQGVPNKELAKRYGVSAPTISEIVHRRNWRYVQPYIPEEGYRD